MKNFQKVLVGLSFIVGLFLNSCESSKTPSIITIQEKFITDQQPEDNIDSPTAWFGENGEQWLIATAKATDKLFVYDALTGDSLREVGGSGTGSGKLKRPNGIAIMDDYVWVVERDNHRVQIFTLPDFTPIGTFGDTLLKKPYGLYLHKKEAGSYTVFVTDDYELPEGQPVDPQLLKNRVHKYSVTVKDSTLDWQLEKMFGDTGAGQLKVVESVYGDPENNILLLAEEDETNTCVKVYDLNGKFSGKVIGEGLFKSQVEGISLYAKSDGRGYWIVTDQSHTANIFHLFSRKDFKHLGGFIAENTTNTDGIWLYPQPAGEFSKGIFFAIDDDAAVSAIDFAEVLKKLGL